MTEGHGGVVGRVDQGTARAVARWRPSAAWLVAAAAALAAAILLQACSASAAVATTARLEAVATTTTNPEAISGALVAPDGRQIVVPYTGGGCVVGARLTATETRSTVTLVLRQVMSGASICPADLIVGLTVTVTLPHPLWGRSLVDGSTHRPIPYFDGRKLLRVTYLPPGFRFSAYTPYPAPAATAWEREFVSRGQAIAPVEVEQVAGKTAVAPSWPVTARLTVGGRPATLSVLTSNGQAFGRAISWRADGYSFVVYTVMVRAGQRLLSAGQLTRIADGLRS